MKKMVFMLSLALLGFASQTEVYDLDKKSILETNNAFEVSDGKKNEIIVKSLTPKDENSIKVIPIKGTENFINGTIEVELLGDILDGMGKGSRGFVGVAFRIQNSKTYDAFYVRPANGRADDQIRRNHSIQYISHPNYTWYRLRKESPKMYETYADMALGTWMKVKIEVDGQKAKFYLNGSKYPTMIVNDLKAEAKKGFVGLWLEPSTKAEFRNLKVTYK